MFKKLLLLPLVVLVACTTTSNLETFSEDNQTKFFSTNNSTDLFDEFLIEIRKDELRASEASRAFKATESALGFGTLAAGLFGGYTAGFTNSVDLKEAGFIAASIFGFSGYIQADKNKSAARQAARRFDCLIREATPFKGDFYESDLLISNSMQQVNIQRGAGSNVTIKRLPSTWTRTALQPRANATTTEKARAAQFTDWNDHRDIHSPHTN